MNPNQHRDPALERWVDKALRDQPLHRAPADLESRVMAEIARRATAPWWQGSFGDWPVAARLLFLIVAVGFAKLGLEATTLLMTPLDPGARSAALFADVSWITSLFAAMSAALRGLPSLWIYGGLTAIALFYLTLFGVSAAAYRTLYATR